MSRVLIAGCGYVGTRLAGLLDGQGHKVWGLRRSPGPFPGGVQTLRADLGDPRTLDALPSDLDYVFYTAGASEYCAAAYEVAYVAGIRNLLAALEARGQKTRRILFTSSTAVYAQRDGEWVDEDSPTEPPTFSGKTMLEAEGLLEASPFGTVTLRLGGIYGPERTELIDRVRRGEAKREKTDRYLNLIHLEDIVGALVHMMSVDEPDAVYVAVDSDPQPRNQLLCWIAQQLGLADPPVATQSNSRRPPRNRRCSNARLRASGYVFKYPSCLEGYSELF